MKHVGSRPVFVDRTGRRRQIVALFGVGLAVLLVSGLVVLLAGLSGGSGWHVPGFPDANGAGNGSGLAPTPSVSIEPTPATGQTPSAGTNPVDASPSTGPTSPRRIPTHTPSHQAKPTKT